MISICARIFQITSIFNVEMKKAGHAVNNNLCPHFAMSRQTFSTLLK